jgi:hypothetical protein
MSQRPKTSTGYRQKSISSLTINTINENKKLQSGAKSDQAFIEFINKDIIKPLHRRNLYSALNHRTPPLMNNNNIINHYYTNPNSQRPLTSKWAIGTIAPPINWETLPKKQQFKRYYFPPDYKNKNPEKYRNYSLKTDHIGIRDNRINKVKDKESYLKMKAEYSTQIESKEGWKPFEGFETVNNRPSVNYNIITCQPLVNQTNSKNDNILNKHVTNRTKGIGELADLHHTYRPNFNKDYAKLLTNNPERFRKFTGIFTQMYDATVRNGGMGNPFEHHKTNIK